MLSLVSVLGLTGVDYVTHDDTRCINTNGVINLDTVDFLEIEGEHKVDEDSAEKIKAFINKYPDWRVMVPYEGYVIYFFSKQPEVIPLKDTVRLHNGACARCSNTPKNALIILDMD
jgi:hypothetical protein